MTQRHGGGRWRGALGALLCLALTAGVAGATTDEQAEDSPERPRIRVRLVTPESPGESAGSEPVRGRVAADGTFVIPIRRPGTTDATSGARRPVSITPDVPEPAGAPTGQDDPGSAAPASAGPAPTTARPAEGSLFDRLVRPGAAGVSGDDLLERPPAAGAADRQFAAAGVDRPAAGSPGVDPDGAVSPGSFPGASRSSADGAGSVTPAAERSRAAADGRTYRLGPGDTVDVFVWRDPDLSRQVPVRPDGLISLPLVGEIQAAGRTPAELETVVTERLSEYVQMPSVTVTVTQIRSLVIYVVGNVAKPGPQTLEREINVLQAIAMAGGLNEFADEDDIVVVRTDVDGTERRFEFDYSDVVDGSRPELNIRLRSGDIVYVP